MTNFWNNLSTPFFILAPMEDVTDTVFRQIIITCGRPDVVFTEFTNCEGLQSKGQQKIALRLKYSKKEKPIVAQVWGVTPEEYYKSAKKIVELGFDGLDINMGCPVKKVIKLGACSALIKNQNLAKEIVLATKEGLNNKIPLSIKTRLGFSTIETDTWIKFVLSTLEPNVLTIHARTVKEKSDTPIHQEEFKKITKLNNYLFYQKIKKYSLNTKKELLKELLLKIKKYR